MNRDVEAALRRSAAQRGSEEERSTSPSSTSRSSSDGEAGSGSTRAKKEASTSSPRPPSTFSGASLLAFLGASPPPPPTKPHDPLPVRFDDDDDDYNGGDEEQVSLAAFKGRLRSAAELSREEQRRRKRLLLLSLLASLLVLVASALATLASAPWWLSATVLKPPRTREVPFALVPRGRRGGDGETSTAGASSGPLAPEGEIVPRVIHQSWKTHATPPQWDEARRSCLELHPSSGGWEARLWDDGEAREAVVAAAARIEAREASRASSRGRRRGEAGFSAEKLVETYDSYSNPVQRADLSRYAILYLHGGVYLDLDVRCERPLDAAELGLLTKSIVLPRTWPAGISNDVVVAAPGSGLLELALKSAVVAKRATSALLFFSSYARVMFSTGPMFLTLVALSWERRREELWVLPARLYGKYREEERGRSRREGPFAEEATAGCEAGAADGGDGGSGERKKQSKRLHGAGAACGALFTHLHGSSWHGKDAEIVASLVGRKRRGGGSGGGGGKATTTAAAAAFLVGAAAVAARRARRQAQQQREQQQTLPPQQQLPRKPLPSSKKPQKRSQRPLGFIGSKAKGATATTELGQKQF